jgi:hypothetical protein
MDPDQLLTLKLKATFHADHEIRQDLADLLKERERLMEQVDRLERHILDLERADRKGW